nr:integrase, catalytic region, zinc finger, CCHC-type, peptidase aspartic, catalytic [Tanacetum cinerariifolium]
CMKHMTGNLKLLCNFIEKFLETVHFGNDQFAPILGYADLVQENVTINRVYYVEGLNHNLFSVGQFCDADLEIIHLILFIVDYRCTKHMTGNLKLLCNFIEKFLETVHFGNDQFAPILGYADLVQENVTINRVYYVEGLNHNLFSVGQFCDPNLENGVVKIRNRTLVKAARTMLSASKLPLFFWAEDEFFNARSNPQEKQPLTNIPSTLAPSTHTYVHADENNNDQAKEEEHV